MEENKKPQNKLNIELSDEVAAGIYSNLAVINHSVSEFSGVTNPRLPKILTFRSGQ